jgi:hypothetical protein
MRRAIAMAFPYHPINLQFWDLKSHRSQLSGAKKNISIAYGSNFIERGLQKGG